MATVLVQRKARATYRRRKWAYVQRPHVFEMVGCPCGNNDPDWSEYAHRLYCSRCKIDFIPRHAGIFDGPIGVEVSEMLGIYFDRIVLKTGRLRPDPWGKSHFSKAELGERE